MPGILTQPVAAHLADNYFECSFLRIFLLKDDYRIKSYFFLLFFGIKALKVSGTGLFFFTRSRNNRTLSLIRILIVQMINFHMACDL